MSYSPDIRDQIDSLTKVIAKALNEHACIKDYAVIKTYNKVTIYGDPYVLELAITLAKEGHY